MAKILDQFEFNNEMNRPSSLGAYLLSTYVKEEFIQEQNKLSNMADIYEYSMLKASQLNFKVIELRKEREEQERLLDFALKRKAALLEARIKMEEMDDMRRQQALIEIIKENNEKETPLESKITELRKQIEDLSNALEQSNREVQEAEKVMHETAEELENTINDEQMLRDAGLNDEEIEATRAPDVVNLHRMGAANVTGSNLAANKLIALMNRQRSSYDDEDTEIARNNDDGDDQLSAKEIIAKVVQGMDVEKMNRLAANLKNQFDTFEDKCQSNMEIKSDLRGRQNELNVYLAQKGIDMTPYQAKR